MSELLAKKKPHNIFWLYFVIVFVAPCFLLAKQFVQFHPAENDILTAALASAAALALVLIGEYKVFPKQDSVPWQVFAPLAANLFVGLLYFGLSNAEKGLTQGLLITFCASLINLAICELRTAMRSRAIAEENAHEFTSPFLQEYWHRRAAKPLYDEYVGVVGTAVIGGYASYQLLLPELQTVDQRGQILIICYFVFSVISVVWTYNRRSSV